VSHATSSRRMRTVSGRDDVPFAVLIVVINLNIVSSLISMKFGLYVEVDE